MDQNEANSAPASAAVSAETFPAKADGSRLLPRLALTAIVLATMLYPGDAPWINDEPLLLGRAMTFNHGLADHSGIHVPFTSITVGYVGLRGTRGAVYGPFPVWIYQLFLLVTRKPVVMIVLRAGMVSTVTAIALDWLLRSIRMSSWLAVVVMLSPWLWIYSRQLWDNSFNIPLSAMMLAAYADFLATKKAWSLRLAIFCACLMPLIHLMSAAILLPLALHLFFYQFSALRRHLWSIAIIFIVTQALAWPYWYYLALHYQSGYAADHSPWAGFLYPLLGAHHLSAAGLGNILGDDWLYSNGIVFGMAIALAQTISLLAYLAVWVGIVLAIPRARRVIKRNNASVTDHLAFIALGTLICQSLLDGTQRVYDGPHYFNATWIAYAIFAFFSIDALRKRASRGFFAMLLIHAQGIAMAIVLLALVLKVHHDGGSRTDGYGTVISQQIAAVEQIAQLSGHKLKHPAFSQWVDYPWAYDVLHDLLPPPDDPRTDRLGIVHYRDAFPGDAHIVVDSVPLPDRKESN